MIILFEKIIKKIKRDGYMLFHKGQFCSWGCHSRIISPLQIDGPSNIFIGSNVLVEYKTWLAALPLTGMDTCKLIIEDGTTIGHFNHIYATHSITIEKNVLTADKVYISDNLHNYQDVMLPVAKQPIRQCKPVVIGEGSWIGENVCIIGASVGKHCVIGANSVVTHDIPDYCVAVGGPAEVIKRFHFQEEKWV